MEKWEEKYERYKNGELAEKINKLQEKQQKSSLNIKEYNELGELLKLESNLSYVTNLIEYRDSITPRIEKLEKEKELLSLLPEVDERLAKVENDIENLEKEYNSRDSKLTDKTISSDEKKKILDEMDSIANLLNERSNKKAGLENAKNSMKDVSSEKVNAELNDLKDTVRQCNATAHRLMDGWSIKVVEEYLSHWDERKKGKNNKEEVKIDDQKNNKEKVELKEKVKIYEPKNNQEKVELNEESKYPIEEVKEELEEDKHPMEEVKEELEENKKPEQKYVKAQDALKDWYTDGSVPTLTFAEKHPRLAKIGNVFSNIFSNIKNKLASVFTKNKKQQEEKLEDEKEFVDNIPDIVEEESVKENIEENKKEVKEQIKQEIKEENKEPKVKTKPKYLTIIEIAEKGMAGIEAEKRKNAEKIYTKAREEAQKLNDDKYSKGLFGNPFKESIKTPTKPVKEQSDSGIDR